MIIKKVLESHQRQGKGLVGKVLASSSRQWRAKVSDLLDYITNPETENGDEKCLEYWGNNFFSRNPERMKTEIGSLVRVCEIRTPRPKQVVQHWIMSWNEREKPNLDICRQSADLFLKRMGFERNQSVCGIHVNTENIHAHMMIAMTNPVTHRSCAKRDDAMLAHAALAEICVRTGAEPEANALFTWNICEGPKPNPFYKPRNSVSFRYVSPEPLMLEIPPNFRIPEFSDARRKGDCWYAPGQETPFAVLDENRIWFYSWMRKDLIEELRLLKNSGYPLEIQNNPHVVSLFMETRPEESKSFSLWLDSSFNDRGENVFDGGSTISMIEEPCIRIRSRAPAIPVVAHERPQAPPWQKWEECVRKYARKVSELRRRYLCAIHMRLHSYLRREIEECLMREGLPSQYARHLTRWLYSPKGSMEILRARKSGLLYFEKPGKSRQAKKPFQKFAMRLGRFGELLFGKWRKGKAPFPGAQTFAEREERLMDSKWEIRNRKKPETGFSTKEKL